jgi:hypothetical protein
MKLYELSVERYDDVITNDELRKDLKGDGLIYFKVSPRLLSQYLSAEDEENHETIQSG